MPTVHRPFLPLCLHCKKNKIKRYGALFCSKECYSDSGHRAAVGKINGPKWAEKYWESFDEIFYRKYGHLPRVDQTRLLVKVGMRKAYKDEYKKKLEIIGQRKVG